MFFLKCSIVFLKKNVRLKVPRKLHNKGENAIARISITAKLPTDHGMLKRILNIDVSNLEASKHCSNRKRIPWVHKKEKIEKKMTYQRELRVVSALEPIDAIWTVRLIEFAE